MSKRPKSVTDLRMSDVALEYEAKATSEAIRAAKTADAIIKTAIVEMKPRDFIEFIKRARDREAAADVLGLLRRYPANEYGLRARLESFREILEDCWHVLKSLFRRSDWKLLKEDVAELRIQFAEAREEFAFAKALTPHRIYEDWFVHFVGDGPDTSIMRRVLHEHRYRMTYHLGEQLRRKLELALRTSAEIAEDQAKKRAPGNIYIRPN